LHQRWRAAAEKYRRNPAVRHLRRYRCDLRFIGPKEPRLIYAAVPNVAVEVAVRTLRQAKGPVDVDAEGSR